MINNTTTPAKSQINSYSTLWSYVWFHVPNFTPKEKHRCRKFTRIVRRLDASAVAYHGRGSALVARRFDEVSSELEAALPPGGMLKVVGITDKQIEKSHVAFNLSRGQS